VDIAQIGVCLASKRSWVQFLASQTHTYTHTHKRCKAKENKTPKATNSSSSQQDKQKPKPGRTFINNKYFKNFVVIMQV
jgi:hypothetical protein